MLPEPRCSNSPMALGRESLKAPVPESWLRRTQTLGAFRGALKQPPHLSTSAVLARLFSHFLLLSACTRGGHHAGLSLGLRI